MTVQTTSTLLLFPSIIVRVVVLMFLGSRVLCVYPTTRVPTTNLSRTVGGRETRREKTEGHLTGIIQGNQSKVF